MLLNEQCLQPLYVKTEQENASKQKTDCDKSKAGQKPLSQQQMNLDLSRSKFVTCLT